MRGLNFLMFLMLVVLCFQASAKSTGAKKITPAMNATTPSLVEDMAKSFEEDSEDMMLSKSSTTEKPMSDVGAKPEKNNNIEMNLDKTVDEEYGGEKTASTTVATIPKTEKQDENADVKPKDENNAAEETDDDDDDEVMSPKSEEDDEESGVDPLNMMPASTSTTTTEKPKTSTATTAIPNDQQQLDEPTATTTITTTTTTTATTAQPDTMAMEDDIRTVLDACKKKRRRGSSKKERKALKKLCKEIGRHQAEEEQQKLKEQQSTMGTSSLSEAIKRLEERFRDRLNAKRQHH